MIIFLYSDALESIMDSVRYSNHQTRSYMQSNLVGPDFNHFFLAVDCGPLSVPMNGSSSGNITVFPNSVQFNCDPGFILHGSVMRTCQANGTWSGFRTLCSGMLKSEPWWKCTQSSGIILEHFSQLQQLSLGCMLIVMSQSIGYQFSHIEFLLLVNLSLFFVCSYRLSGFVTCWLLLTGHLRLILSPP